MLDAAYERTHFEEFRPCRKREEFFYVLGLAKDTSEGQTGILSFAFAVSLPGLPGLPGLIVV